MISFSKLVIDILKRILIVSAILVTVMTIASAAHGQVSIQDYQAQRLTVAIARTEGFYVKGSVPNRFHNPGDIRSKLRHGYTGQVGLSPHGYVIFAKDEYGWIALRSQIQKVIENKSHLYDSRMTFRQFGRLYAESPQWPRTLCKILGVPTTMTLAEFFGDERPMDERYINELWTLRVPQVHGVWIMPGVQAYLR